MKHLLRPFALLILVALSALPLPARAELHIDITRGKIEPLPIAIPTFAGGASAANDITQVVSADLERSGLFKPIDPQAFVDKDPSSHVPPNYGDWRVINAQALLTGSATQMPDGRLQVEFRLWDVFAQQQLTGLRYTTTASNWRRIAHIIADAVYKRITGEDGYFDTRIVYIAESGPLDHRVKRLAIMDQDGANNRYLTDGKALVLTPRFSPSTQEITYLSYARGTPRVYLFNIDTGQQEVLGDVLQHSFAEAARENNLRVVGANRFDLKYGIPGMTNESLLTAIRLYGTEVVPRVRDLLARVPPPSPQPALAPRSTPSPTAPRPPLRAPRAPKSPP